MAHGSYEITILTSEINQYSWNEINYNVEIKHVVYQHLCYFTLLVENDFPEIIIDKGTSTPGT